VKPRVVRSLRVPRDFRRTAVRNLERAGVPRSTAKGVVGHRMESIYRRDAIVDEPMLKDGAAKLECLYRAEPAARTGVRMREASTGHAGR
jgi:hypothetical protein